MSLRLKANLFFGLLILIFISIMMAREFDNTRRSVYEEIGAANRVATQVLKQVISVYQQADEQKFMSYLHELTPIRSFQLQDLIFISDHYHHQVNFLINYHLLEHFKS